MKGLGRHLRGLAATAQRPSGRRVDRPRGQPGRRALAELPGLAGRGHRALRGDANPVRAPPGGVPRLGGLRIAAGFRRQVAGLLGEHPFAGHVLDAAIEAARPVPTGDADRPARFGLARSRGVPPARPRGLARAPRPLLHLPGRDPGPLRGSARCGRRRSSRCTRRRRAGRSSSTATSGLASPRAGSTLVPLPVDVRPGPRVRALVTTWTARTARSSPTRALTPPPSLYGHLRGAAATGAGHGRREAGGPTGRGSCGGGWAAGRGCFQLTDLTERPLPTVDPGLARVAARRVPWRARAALARPAVSLAQSR